MEIRVSHSPLRLIEACLFLAFGLAIGSSEAHAQLASMGAKQSQPPPARITAWQSDVSGGIHLLHQLFPDINPKSKVIVESNRNWGDSPEGTGWFTIYVCEPDSPSRNAELQRDSFTRDDIQCSVPTLHADFLMGGSQLGPVPVWVITGQPAMEKRWSELATLLIAHPEWSKVQVQEKMRASGVKYGEDSRSQVMGSIHSALTRLGPFLGNLTVDSVDYAAPHPTDEKELLPPAWVVKVHPSGQDKTKPWINYVVVFDAFDGAFESEQKFTQLGSSGS